MVPPEFECCREYASFFRASLVLLPQS
jgi:hypothetical protein